MLFKNFKLIESSPQLNLVYSFRTLVPETSLYSINKKHQEKYLIKPCATLTEKVLTTVYKSKIIRFKMDEDPLQRRIYFLTFVDSLEMIFS